MLEMVELLHRIYGQFLREMLPVIKGEGISPTEMIILRKVYMKGTYRAMDLARATDLPPSTITGIIDRLVARDYVIRIHDAEDRRSVLVQGTPELKRVMAQVEFLCDAKLKEVFKDMSEDFITTLIKDMKELNQYLVGYRNETAQEEGDSTKA